MRRRAGRTVNGGIAGALLALALACSSGESAEEPSAVQVGQQVYRNVCIACHNADPAKDGSLGPAVAGASRELLEAKVLRGEYPPGYTPKRPGGVMPVYAYLEPRIGELAAYVASIAPAD